MSTEYYPRAFVRLADKLERSARAKNKKYVFLVDAEGAVESAINSGIDLYEMCPYSVHTSDLGALYDTAEELQTVVNNNLKAA